MKTIAKSVIKHEANQLQLLPDSKNNQTLASSQAVTALTISKLNDFDLESELGKLIHQERKLLHLIPLHIKEVENRKLYLKKAYPSLFEYLVITHGYSAGSAMRRIEAARLLRDVPEMANQIQTGC